jgi:hypothetical protein
MHRFPAFDIQVRPWYVIPRVSCTYSKLPNSSSTLHDRTTSIQLLQYSRQEFHSQFLQFIILAILLIASLVIATLLLATRVSALLVTALLWLLSMESTMLLSLVITICGWHSRRTTLEVDIHPSCILFCCVL